MESNFSSSTKWKGTVGRIEEENQYSEKKGCRRKLKIWKEKVSVLRYSRKGEISDEFHWCTIYAPCVIGKSHLPNGWDATDSICLLQGSCKGSHCCCSFILDTELVYLHWIVNSIWGQNKLKIQLLRGSARVLNRSSGWLHKLVGALHLQLCLRNSLELN